MTSPREAFGAGYRQAQADIIDLILKLRLASPEPGWREHNVALGLAIYDIRELDVRLAMNRKLQADVESDLEALRLTREADRHG